MVAGAVAIGPRLVLGQSRQHEDIGTHRGQRLQRAGKNEVGTGRGRRPVGHVRPVGNVDERHADRRGRRRRCRCLRGACRRRHQRFEVRQGQQRAEAAQERPARKMDLGAHDFGATLTNATPIDAAYKPPLRQKSGRDASFREGPVFRIPNACRRWLSNRSSRPYPIRRALHRPYPRPSAGRRAAGRDARGRPRDRHRLPVNALAADSPAGTAPSPRTPRKPAKGPVIGWNAATGRMNADVPRQPLSAVLPRLAKATGWKIFVEPARKQPSRRRSPTSRCARHSDVCSPT